MSVLGDRLARARRGPGADFNAEAAVETALNGSPERIVGARGAEDDAKRLRGIPVVGGPLGGAIPGSSPHRSARLDRWRGR